MCLLAPVVVVVVVVVFVSLNQLVQSSLLIHQDTLYHQQLSPSTFKIIPTAFQAWITLISLTIIVVS
jgi:hypothetical protein